MAHVEKHTRAEVGRMFAHYNRENKNYSNDKIDTSKSHLNYNLAEHNMSSMDFLNKRLSEVKVQNRKDVNVMCSWLVTAPKNLKQEDTKKFFELTYEFLSNRYKKENVISANVHLDETTPHLHFAFVPVTEDRKKGGYKVSAKEVINRTELRHFHTDLQDYITKNLGYKVDILNGATANGNKTVQELKAETLQKENEKLKKENESLQKENEELENKILSCEPPKKNRFETQKSYEERAKTYQQVQVVKTKNEEQQRKDKEQQQKGEELKAREQNIQSITQQALQEQAKEYDKERKKLEQEHEKQITQLENLCSEQYERGRERGKKEQSNADESKMQELQGTIQEQKKYINQMNEDFNIIERYFQEEHNIDIDTVIQYQLQKEEDYQY